MKNKRGTPLLLLGGVLLLIAVGMAGFLWWEESAAQSRSAQVLENIRQTGGTISPSGEGIPAEPAQASAGEKITYPVAGILTVDKLDLTLPVLDDCTEDLLNVSVCRYLGGLPDQQEQMVVSGHNYRGLFKDLDKLKAGDRVWLEDLEGDRHGYRVSGTEIIDGDDIPALEAGEWQLTLFTCNFDGRKRIVVRCLRDE